MRRQSTPPIPGPGRAPARPAGASRAPSPAPDATPPAAGDDDAPLFPSLKRRSAEERADEIVAALKDAILNPGRLDGGTGMAYSDWAKVARKRITRAIREAEASVAMRELMSANRIGGLCLRVGFLLLASVLSFAAFWYGAIHIWRTYGPAWGVGAILSSVGLSFAFVVAGLLLSGSDIEEMRSKVRRKVGDES